MVTRELPVRQRGGVCGIPITIDPVLTNQTAELLKAMADPTRVAMVAALARSEAPVCICDFTSAFSLTQPTISHHMSKLKAAGLVEASRRGVWTYYELRRDLPMTVSRLLEAVVAGSMDAPSPSGG
jgi:ArsR family transcriptional regulator, arsenate/arsenite/antimonite-responsive transcriptional repressor